MRLVKSLEGFVYSYTNWDHTMLILIVIGSLLLGRVRLINAQNLIHESDFPSSPPVGEFSAISSEDDELSKTMSMSSYSEGDEKSSARNPVNGSQRPKQTVGLEASNETRVQPVGSQPVPIWVPVDDTPAARVIPTSESGEEFAGQAAESNEIAHQFISVLNNQSNVVINDPGNRVNYRNDEQHKSVSINQKTEDNASGSNQKDSDQISRSAHSAIGFNESSISPTSEGLSTSGKSSQNVQSTIVNELQTRKNAKRRKSKVRTGETYHPSSKTLGAMIAYSAIPTRPPDYSNLPILMSFNGSPTRVSSLDNHLVMSPSPVQMRQQAPNMTTIWAPVQNQAGFSGGFPYTQRSTSKQILTPTKVIKLTHRAPRRPMMETTTRNSNKSMKIAQEQRYVFSQTQSNPSQAMQKFFPTEQITSNTELVKTATSPIDSTATTNTSFRLTIGPTMDADEDDGSNEDDAENTDTFDGTSLNGSQSVKASNSSIWKIKDNKQSERSQASSQTGTQSLGNVLGVLSRPDHAETNGSTNKSSSQLVNSSVNMEHELLVGPFRSESEAPASITLAGIVYQKSGSSSALVGAPMHFSDGEREPAVSGSTSSSTTNLPGYQAQSQQKQSTLATNAASLQPDSYSDKLWQYLTVYPEQTMSTDNVLDNGNVILGSVGGESSKDQHAYIGAGGISSTTTSYRISVPELGPMNSLKGVGLHLSPSATIVTTGSSPARAKSKGIADSTSGNMMHSFGGKSGSSDVGSSSLISILDSATNLASLSTNPSSMGTKLSSDAGTANIWPTDQKDELQYQGSSMGTSSSDLTAQGSKHTKEKPIVIVQKDVKPVKYHLLRAYLKLRRLLRPFETTYVFPNESSGYMRRRKDASSNNNHHTRPVGLDTRSSTKKELVITRKPIRF